MLTCMIAIPFFFTYMLQQNTILALKSLSDISACAFSVQSWAFRELAPLHKCLEIPVFFIVKKVLHSSM